MATNIINDGEQISLNVGADKKSGAAVVVGFIHGICLTDANSSGDATVWTETVGVASLSVLAKTTNSTAYDTNTAVAYGDKLYYDTATGTISPESTGEPFGTALGAIAAGATATINVAIKA